MRIIGPAISQLHATANRLSKGAIGLSLMLAALISLFVPLSAAYADDPADNAKYSAIVVDAQTGEVFYARRADSARYPASLTKIMTLYMAFDALARGELKPTDLITMSAHGAAQAPVKIYLKPGDTIDVDTAMRIIALYSANDLAVALAEKIGGTEERFAALMTIRAQELGMTQTRFVNANGLPDSRQLSSARDMAILARAVLRDYPQYYNYFNLASQDFRGKTYYNHNPLRGLDGVDGMKTGYTNAAGYNLVASQVKNGHRLIAVMLGGSNSTQRREHVTKLMRTGFDVIDRRNRGEVITIAQNEFTRAINGALPPVPSAPVPYTVLAANSKPLTDAQLRETLAGSEMANASDTNFQRASATIKSHDIVQALTARPGVADLDAELKADTKASTKKTVAAKTKKKDPTAVYAIQVGAFKDKSLASDWAKKVNTRFRSELSGSTTQVVKNGNGWYRTRFASLT
ncbi:MAG: D-alanyl-D-alanine carboxypeptidase, partial [Asticcacaulis sp.]